MFARLELLSYFASHNKYYKYDDKKKKKSRRNPIYLFTHQVSVSLLIKFEQTYTISLSNLQNYLNRIRPDFDQKQQMIVSNEVKG